MLKQIMLTGWFTISMSVSPSNCLIPAAETACETLQAATPRNAAAYSMTEDNQSF
jgi:hypothetical protein